MAQAPKRFDPLEESSISSELIRIQKARIERLRLSQQFMNNMETVIDLPRGEFYENVVCNKASDMSLDVVNSLPDFDGEQKYYASWRSAAHTAYEMLLQGSSIQFQAVAIIRNKVIGPANMLLFSYDTPLNFRAIIKRLDSMYADKRPLHLMERELFNLRQENMTLLDFYDELLKKHTFIKNKIIMTYDDKKTQGIIKISNMDALRVFILNTRSRISDILLHFNPKDLPNALAIAVQVDANPIWPKITHPISSYTIPELNVYFFGDIKNCFFLMNTN